MFDNRLFGVEDDAPREQDALPKPPKGDSSSVSTKILVVEDCKAVARVVSLVLRKSGHETFVAHSGDEALRLFDLNGPFDVLLTDIVLPGRNCGYEVAEKLKNKKPDLQVIFTTGYPLESVEKEPGFSGRIQHLMKPAMISEIRDAVAAAILSHRTSRPDCQ